MVGGPPPGQLTFICEWPMYRIPPSRHAVDAHAIREAASRAIHLWPSAGQDEGSAVAESCRPV